MMRTRLRPTPVGDELAEMYAKPHDHTAWNDHIYRVDMTSVIAHHMLTYGGTVADLSCGNGLIARRLEASHNAQAFLGDLAPGYQFTGPIEETIKLIPRVNLFICSETIEHLDDPDAVLTAIRGKADQVLLSTPDGEDDDENPQHVWGWDSEAVQMMLRDAGFTPQVHSTLDFRPMGGVYSFQLWACR